MPCFIAFCYLTIHRYCGLLFVCFFLFYKLKGCGIHSSSKSVKAIFTTTFAHFMSLLLIGTVFGLLHHYYICYGSLSSVIFGVTVIVWGLHETAHIRWQISSTNVVCSDCPPTGRSLISLPLHRLPCPLTHNNMKLGQLITLRGLKVVT